MKIYNRTVAKIRQYLDVNKIIKYGMELKFLKSILFSKNIQKVFNSFSDLKSLGEEKVNVIHNNLKFVYEYNQNGMIDENNIITGEEKVKDMDHYAVHYFVENFIKKF